MPGLMQPPTQVAAAAMVPDTVVAPTTTATPLPETGQPGTEPDGQPASQVEGAKHHGLDPFHGRTQGVKNAEDLGWGWHERFLSFHTEPPAPPSLFPVVSAVDVTATMVEALGAPALPNAVGRSLLPLLGAGNASGDARSSGIETGDDWEDLAFSEYCSDEFCPEGGCYQRMVRLGDWKLIYYHGQEPQLFNLANDPDELADRAGDPTCRSVREELEGRVLSGWDPEQIAQEMAAKLADIRILSKWAQATRPADQFRWALRPEMNYLEPEED